jgi:hypothetical protein
VPADLPHQYEVLLAKATAGIHLAGLAIEHPYKIKV